MRYRVGHLVREHATLDATLAPEVVGGQAVHEGTGARGAERLRTDEQRCNHATQYVARATRRKQRISRRIDGDPLAGRADDRRGTLEQDDLPRDLDGAADGAEA